MRKVFVNTLKKDNDLFKFYLEKVIARDECKPLSKEEQIKLGSLYKKGNKDAGEKLIKSNLRLVIKTALNYLLNNNCEIMDLIQEGNKGLLEALLKYEPERNVKFSTFASFFIKRNVIRHSYQTSNKGAPISLEEVCEKYGNDEFFILFYRESINTALKRLSKMERDIIELYFNLNNRPKRTLIEITREYNFNYKKTLQIKKEALKKLKKILNGDLNLRGYKNRFSYQ